MAFALGLGEIFEGRAVVQNRVIVHELNIAGFEFHHQVELRVICQFVEEIERFDLQRAEWFDTGKAPR